MISLDLQSIKRIEKEFGNPVYVFDEAGFVSNYERFRDTMKRYYPKYQESYSYKTNYTPYICSLVKKMGGYAEVVSDMEYKIAKTIGYKDDHIIFNGPDKESFGIEAIFNGSLVNIDNINELNNLRDVLRKKNKKEIKIGLRVNVDVGQGFISRFGMDEKDLKKAFRIVSEVPGLKIVGLHCHISRCRGKEAWKKRTETILSYVDRFFDNQVPDYIDLGSGMFGEMDSELAAQFGDIPTYEEYAAVTAAIVADHFRKLPECEKPLLFTEPGTTLINKYIDFVGKINAIKTINKKNFAILNCSYHNLGEVCTLKQLPVRVISSGTEQNMYEKVDFVGYTCLEQDVMYNSYKGKMGVGDYVQFGNTGGYSNVYKPPFIRPGCGMIVKKKNGKYEEIKRRETGEDILHTYIF